MRVLLKTVRFLAGLIYCALGLIACLVVLLMLWSLIAGAPVPVIGALGHGNVSFPSGHFILTVISIVMLIVGCDIFFRVMKKYRDDLDGDGQ